MLHIRLIALTFSFVFAVAGCSAPGSGVSATGSSPARATEIPTDWPYRPPMQIDAELAQLHSQLRITPAQQPQWDEFAGQVGTSSRHFHATLDNLKKADPKMTGLGTYHDLQLARLKVYDQVNPLYQKLYAVLSPSQRNAFSNLLVGPREEMCGLLCRDGVLM
jgi:periplasmic protein CpxP/Spy